jgi:lipopolysaccharide transport system permease protein
MLVPDFGYFLNSFLMFILFITPIGFRGEMATGATQALVVINPFTYMVSTFRSVLSGQHGIDWRSIVIFAVISIAVFILGCAFFRRIRTHLVDYE